MGSPTADVRLNIAANSAAAQYDMLAARMKRMLKTMGDGTDDVKKKSKDAGSEFGRWAGGLGKAAGSIALMGLAFKGVQTVVEAISDEFQKMIDLSNNAKERQVPYEDRLKSFLFQSTPAVVKDPEKFVKTIDDMIQKSSVRDKSAALEIIQTTMSTMGAMEPMERAEFGLAIAQGRRDLLGGSEQDALKAFAGVSGMAHLAFKHQGSTPLAQLGLMQKTITSSAVADMTSFSRNIAPLGNKLQDQFGWNQIEGLAFGSALSTALNDQTGQLVETVGTNIASKLFMAEKRFGIDAEGKSAFERQAMIRSDDPRAKEARHYLMRQFELESEQLSESDRAMMSEAALNKEFLPKLGGRAKTLFTSMQFFQPQGTADDEKSLNHLFRAAVGDMGGVWSNKDVVDMKASYARLEAMERENQRLAQESPLFKSASRDMETKTALEGVLQAQDNTAIGEVATSESEFNKLIRSTGKNWLDRKVDETKAWFSGSESLEDSLVRQQEIIKGARRQLLYRESVKEGIRFNPQFDAPLMKDPSQFFSAENLKKLGFDETTVQSAGALSEKLDSIVRELQLLRAEQKQPKDVKVNEPGKKPDKPAAAVIGK